MIKRYILAAFALAMPLLASGQRKDIMDRSYITPTRIVWTSGDVSNPDVLLREGDGQPNLAGYATCNLCSKDGTPSIILDYGRELHGGLKLIDVGRENYPKLARHPLRGLLPLQRRAP